MRITNRRKYLSVVTGCKYLGPPLGNGIGIGIARGASVECQLCICFWCYGCEITSWSWFVNYKQLFYCFFPFLNGSAYPPRQLIPWSPGTYVWYAASQNWLSCNSPRNVVERESLAAEPGLESNDRCRLSFSSSSSIADCAEQLETGGEQVLSGAGKHGTVMTATCADSYCSVEIR